MKKITITLEYFSGDGWTADMRCGEGHWPVYDRGYWRPEQALFDCALELSKMRAHFESESLDHLAECHMGFADVLKPLSFASAVEMVLNDCQPENTEEKDTSNKDA